MDTKRVLIPDVNFDGAAISTALQLLNGLSVEDENIRDCILLIPVKANLQHTTLSAVLGEGASKSLYNGNSVKLGSCSLRLETAKNFKRYTKGDAVLVVYADQKLMDAVDSNGSFKIIISVPEVEDDVRGWQKTWHPIVPGQQKIEPKLVINPIVDAALHSINSRINLANKILNPRDEEAVKDAFRILRAHKQSEDLENIRAWCIKNGWDSKGADEAAKHAKKAFGLKSKPSNYGSQWAANIYEQWVEKSKN